MYALLNFHLAGLLLSVHVGDIRPYGEIVAGDDGKITALREKQSVCRSGCINGGVYFFNRNITDIFPKNQECFSIEWDIFLSVPSLYTLKTEASWIDIEVPERLTYAG